MNRILFTDLLQPEVPALLRLLSGMTIDAANGGCWTCGLKTTHNGYVRLACGGRAVAGHRLAYEGLVGKIPPGLSLDHICRNRACFNPAHLEPVTTKENIQRGHAARGLKTHCIRGHEFTEANIYRRPSKPTERLCRACAKIHARTGDAKRRAKRQSK
jgi:hypothetical protein